MKSPDPRETGSIFAAGEVAGQIRLALPTFVQYVNTRLMTSNGGTSLHQGRDSPNGKPILVVS